MSDIYTILPLEGELHKLSFPKVAYAYYCDRKVDLLTGEIDSFSIEDFRLRLDKVNLKEGSETPILFHLFYELGFYYYDLEYLVSSDDLLAIEIHYFEVTALERQKDISKLEMTSLSEPSFEQYKRAFDLGRQALLDGDCYQFNLTYPFEFSLREMKSIDDVAHLLWKDNIDTADYAHMTVLPCLEKTYLCNSPECLYKIESKESGMTLWTMPIKGTIELDGDAPWQLKWEELLKSTKDEAELSIITDLLRNDLSRIEKPIAEVVETRSPLLVPKILHQYSKIKVELSKDVTLGQIIEAIFPGGSVTGAPKRRVLKILQKLEQRSRAFYCGSTLLSYKSHQSCSINIRSAEISMKDKKMHYQAGGGITLLSNPEDEFAEMKLKVNSFLRTLGQDV